MFQTGTYEGVPYLVAELLEGTTLRELLIRGPRTVRKSIDYGQQLARGLWAAHERGIVHRDLKPENIFVTKGRIHSRSDCSNMFQYGSGGIQTALRTRVADDVALEPST